MKKQRKDSHNGIDFWQPSSDLMTALLLIMMLIIALLLLFLIHVPQEEYFDDYKSESYETEGDGKDVDDKYHEEHTQDYEETHQNSTGAGAGGGGEGNDEGDEPEEFPEGEPGTKSAVYVMLVDGETDRTILEKDVPFNLHSEGGVLQVLNTYYPVKTTYREFLTTNTGVFYLPEKIPQGSYFFKNLKEAKGYELAEDTHFELHNVYDWPDPYVVTIKVYPARNVIHISLKNTEKEAVGKATFEITAAEDITTADGTVRYKEGEKVGKIKCDENGNGDSEELYLGSYKLTQTKIPEYYADIGEPITVTLEKKNGKNDNRQELTCEKTKITFSLKDELNSTPIEGAEFVVSDGESEQTHKTDKRGEIVLEENKKNTTYTFKQVSKVGDYILPDEVKSVTVSDKGRIDGKAAATLSSTNRMIRVNFDIQDAVLKNALSDMSVSLFDSNDTAVKNWTTNGSPQGFTDLKDGNYYVVINGRDAKQFPASIKNTKEIQNITIKVYTIKSYLVLIGAGLTGVLLLYLLIRLLRSTIRKRKQKKETEKDEPKETTTGE